MHITRTAAPKSTVVLEIEVPPERLDTALDQAVRALAALAADAGVSLTALALA